MAVSIGPSFFMPTRTGLEKIAEPVEEAGLLEKLGGLLTRGREKLYVAGRTVKENADLLLLGSMYTTTVALPPAILSEAANNSKFAKSLFGPTANVSPEVAYIMFVVMAIALGVPYAQMYYNRFKTGRPFGI